MEDTTLCVDAAHVPCRSLSAFMYFVVRCYMQKCIAVWGQHVVIQTQGASSTWF